jgi:hypothetical protein
MYKGGKIAQCSAFNLRHRAGASFPRVDEFANPSVICGVQWLHSSVALQYKSEAVAELTIKIEISHSGTRSQ